MRNKILHALTPFAACLSWSNAKEKRHKRAWSPAFTPLRLPKLLSLTAHQTITNAGPARSSIPAVWFAVTDAGIKHLIPGYRWFLCRSPKVTEIVWT